MKRWESDGSLSSRSVPFQEQATASDRPPVTDRRRPRDQPRRAPRLTPDQLIAPHITRVGRFRKIDPTKPKPLPGCAKILGVLAWAGFVGEVARRAYRASRQADAPNVDRDV